MGRLWIFACIVSAVFVSGCFSASGEDKSIVSSNPDLVECNSRESVTARESCYIYIAYTKQNPKLCAEVGSKNLRNACYLKLAKRLQDPGLCLNISKDDTLYVDCMTGAAM